MSDQLSESIASQFIPFAVLLASLVGSAHCVSMCGGLILASSRTKTAQAFYHFGRLIGYTLLGALSGLLGGFALSGSSLRGISVFSSLLLGGFFVFLGLRTFWKTRQHFTLPKTVDRFYGKMLGRAGALKNGTAKAFSVGLLSAFLPCGWLYTFVLAATATHSALHGGIVLFLFWLGTLSALTASPFLIRKVFKPVADAFPKLSGIILILVGCFAVGIRTYPLLKSAPSSSPTECPMHQKQPH